MKISRTDTGFEIADLTLQGLSDDVGRTLAVRLFVSDAEFRRLVTLGAELLLAPPECIFMVG